jgi:hypothetical protein
VARWLLLTVVLAGAGCARIAPPLVRPHQRAHLADRIMRVEGERLSRSADQHVLVTREGAFGGNGTAGGGCGCN